MVDVAASAERQKPIEGSGIIAWKAKDTAASKWSLKAIAVDESQKFLDWYGTMMVNQMLESSAQKVESHGIDSG